MAKKKAKKKRAAKTTGGKKGAGAPKYSAIVYFCDSQCQASSNPAHIGPPGSKVALVAAGTNVTLAFAGGSPFAGPSAIEISANSAVIKTVRATAPAKSYAYNLQCAKCTFSTLAPPEMIVP